MSVFFEKTQLNFFSPVGEVNMTIYGCETLLSLQHKIPAKGYAAQTKHRLLRGLLLPRLSYLFGYPGVGFFNTLLQRHPRLPLQLFLYQRIVGISSPNTGRAGYIVHAYRLARYADNQFRQVVDGNHFFRSYVYRTFKV